MNRVDPTSSPKGTAAVPRVVAAFGIGVAVALVTAILSLLAAVLIVEGDRAVIGALAIALGAGVIAMPTAWWWIGRRRPSRSS